MLGGAELTAVVDITIHWSLIVLKREDDGKENSARRDNAAMRLPSVFISVTRSAANPPTYIVKVLLAVDGGGGVCADSNNQAHSQ